MQHLHSLENISLTDSEVTIGTYDGVHVGHQAIIKPMVMDAHTNGVPAIVITFYPHPGVTLNRLKQSVYLTSPDERAEILGDAGVDYVFTLEFNQTMASLSAKQFIHLLHRHLSMTKLWVGYDFALGHDRLGDIPSLQQMGKVLNFSLHVVPPVKFNHEPVSSRIIRSLVEKGYVAEAAEKLGRWYFLKGIVIPGNHRGKSLGFPTANLQIWPEKLIPYPGVYATWAWFENQKFKSVTNIGYNPTFEDRLKSPRAEVFILDFNESIYNKELKIELVKFLRPEVKFNNSTDLQKQISIDIQNSIEVLKNAEYAANIPA